MIDSSSHERPEPRADAATHEKPVVPDGKPSPSDGKPVVSDGKPSPSDGELVGRTLDGDRSAFDVLVSRYQRQALAVSYRLLGNTPDAMEVTQDAFLKSYTSLRTLEKPEAFGGWLMRIVSNLSLNYRRSRNVRSRGQLPDADLFDASETSDLHGPRPTSPDNPLRAAEGHELGVALELAMKHLPEKQRLALVMFTVEQMPQKQVAEALGCSVEAVKWHVFQGRKKLRELLKDVM